jgi:Domain of unknown function (DUF6429)
MTVAPGKVMTGAAMDRLHRKGMISDAVGKAKSVILTAEGLQRSRELFIKHFGK